MKAALSDFAALNDCAAPLFTVTYLLEQNWGETLEAVFHPLKVSEEAAGLLRPGIEARRSPILAVWF